MRRLTVYLVLFGVLVSLPLVFVAWRTFAAIDREAEAQVRFFADRLLDGMENELAEMVRREEGRAVDAYRHQVMVGEGPRVSPLAGEPAEPFILGYLQNNPDGTFQTPLVDDPQAVPAALTERVAQLESANRQFNQRKRTALPPSASVEPPAEPAVAEKKEQTVFADRFLNPPALEKSKRKLGQEEARVEEITAGQAMNLARQEPERTVASTSGGAASEAESDAAGSSRYDWRSAESAPAVASARRRQAAPSPSSPDAGGRFQAEVAPLQAVSIDGQMVFVFRRIGINGQIYRQGVVLRLQPFLDHLLTRHYDDQPIARYTRLTLTAADVSVARDGDPTAAGPGGGTPLTARVFPAPFGFLTAEMALITLPASPARRTLTLALAVLGLVLVAGLVAIFFSTRAVFDLSERRSRFVSAVTHELKTPLTNIRLYIDMLDQGIAATPEREQEYLGILASESARLSNLINNVLELSRLEKQSRRFDLVEGDLKDVLADVERLMADSLAREGFTLTVDAKPLPRFAYDREVLVQVLSNLMENSLKFGRHLPDKRICLTAHAADGWVNIAVSDSGPGIPRRALKKVFDDFYRVDDDHTQTIGGTGIGLALVKKFVTALGGQVQAANNDGPGCTITLRLPIHRSADS